MQASAEQIAATFTPAMRVSLDDLCKDLSRIIRREVTTDYDETECGQFHTALLCVDSVDAKAWGPVVSITAGPGVPAGFTVVGSDWGTLAEEVSLDDAFQVARREARNEHHRMLGGIRWIARAS